jgi:hypothetical protein
MNALFVRRNAVKPVSLGQIDHAGGLGDESARVKKPDRSEGGTIRRQRLFIRLPANAQRRDDPGSGDGDALARRGGHCGNQDEIRRVKS